MPTSLQQLFAERLQRDPDRRALAWYDARGVVEWQTFAQVHRTATHVAARLREDGLRRGDVCVITLPSSEPSSTVLLAALLAGALPLLVAPPTLQRFNSDLAKILFRTIEKTRARLVVYGEALEESDADWSGLERHTRFVAIDDVLRERDGGADHLPRIRPAADSTAALQLTSGTTTLPRVAVWSQRAVIAALDGMAVAMRLAADDVCFNWTPLYHDMGLVNNFLLCLTRGVPLVMMKPQDFVRRPSLWLRGLHDSGATVTWSPNFGFALAAERIADRDIKGVSLARVRTFWNAAERVHLDTIRSFEARFARHGLRANAVKTNFGCVENVGGATFGDVDGPVQVEYVDLGALHGRGVAEPATPGAPSLAIVGVGRPNPGMKCVALATNRRPLGDGKVGELAFLTPSRMTGYLGDAPATRRALAGPYLRTGDLGYLRDGEVFWVGRLRERITVRGRKIDPSDLESVLGEIRGLRAGCFAAFGVDDPRSGTERIVVVAEAREPLERGADDIRADILERVYRRLDLHISEVLLVHGGALSKTSSGKRRHRRFRELYLAKALTPFLIAPPLRSRAAARKGV